MHNAQPRHGSEKMTREYCRTQAFTAITMCPSDKLDDPRRIRSIANTSGLTVAEVEQLIAERRAREGTNA